MRACLPSEETNPNARADQLATSRGTYRFAYDWPEGVATAAELPSEDNYSMGYALESVGVYLEIGANLAALTIEGIEHGKIQGALRSRFEALEAHELGKHIFAAPKDIAANIPMKWPKSWKEYEALFQVWKAPQVVDFYHQSADRLDLAFAWQRVGGVNPMVLARCSRLPDHFPVDEERFERVMRGDSLIAAAAEGRLYLADYALLDGLTAGVTDGIQKYLSAPIALFAVERGTGSLRPVAIQCGQMPGRENPLVSPGDGWRWRIAMNLVQIADANHHEGVAHLGRTHMIMEAVKVVMERQLAHAHPLYALLHPHVETTLAINESAKTSLIAAGGTVDRCFGPTITDFCGVVRKAVATYRLDETAPAQDMTTRGLDYVEGLPNHPYREDASLVWDAVHEFVTAYVALYYTSDADVGGDTELQAFVLELGADAGGRLQGVPPANTVEQLVFLLTRLLFIAGPQHSAVNFPQFPIMGFVSNMPGASYRPQMSADTPDEEVEYTRMFPPWRIAIEGTTMIFLLSSMRDSKLGDYGLLHFRDLRVHPVVVAFQRRLQEVEKVIEERDPRRLMSYPYLRPSQILQSISI